MRYFPVLPALLVLAALSPAAAQTYTGRDVTVNPSASDTQVLLYPGGKYSRIVPKLRQPGEKAEGTIHLRMPARHRTARHAVHHRRQATAAPKPVSPAVTPPARRLANLPGSIKIETRKPDKPAPQAAPVKPKPQAALVKPKPQAALVKPKPQAAPVKPKPQPAPPPRQTASVAPQPVRTAPAPSVSVETSPGAKRGVILFQPNAGDPSVSAIQTVKSLAAGLNAALADKVSRVQLLAYGGQRGDKSSNARRLSLKRALIIRQLLIDEGVPSERIDVRALGGVDDNGPPDRVDIFLKS